MTPNKPLSQALFDNPGKAVFYRRSSKGGIWVHWAKGQKDRIGLAPFYVAGGKKYWYGRPLSKPVKKIYPQIIMDRETAKDVIDTIAEMLAATAPEQIGRQRNGRVTDDIENDYDKLFGGGRK